MWRVMVIDDEVRQCKGLKNILLREFQGDMEVWDFTMAAEALAFVHSNEVDIIITDICMPEMDGLQFMEETAKENPGIKVILLTGYAEFEYARKALTPGSAGLSAEAAESGSDARGIGEGFSGNQ